MTLQEEFVFDPANYHEDESDGSYRHEFLRCLKLDRWDGGAVDGKIEVLRAATEGDPIVAQDLTRAKAAPEWQRLEQFLPSGVEAHAEYAFRLLLSYDYFHVFMHYLGCVVGGVTREEEREGRARALLEKLSS